MDKIDLIKQPVDKELNDFRALFEASLTSSNPRLQDVLSYINKVSNLSFSTVSRKFLKPNILPNISLP